MIIKTRHIDTNNKLLGYTLLIEDEEVYVNPEIAICLSSAIDNVVFLNKEEFIEKEGYTIDTVVNYSNSDINNSIISDKSDFSIGNSYNNKIILNKTDFYKEDYYNSEYLNTCRAIRNCMLRDPEKIKVDTSSHTSNNGANVYLIKFIELCGMDFKKFVISYLSTLQPYSLEPFRSKSHSKSDIWLLDIGYKIKLLIKVDLYDKQKPVIISFHESNSKGRFFLGSKDFSDKLCAVLVDNVKKLPNGYRVSYTIQRGFIRYTVESTTKYYNSGAALVKYQDIEAEYRSIIELVMEHIIKNYSSDSISATASFIKKLDTGKISFLSNGFSSVNNIMLLLDLYSRYTDKSSRNILSQLASSILCEMPEFKQKDFKEAIECSHGRYDGNELLKLLKYLLYLE